MYVKRHRLSAFLRVLAEISFFNFVPDFLYNSIFIMQDTVFKKNYVKFFNSFDSNSRQLHERHF